MRRRLHYNLRSLSGKSPDGSNQRYFHTIARQSSALMILACNMCGAHIEVLAATATISATFASLAPKLSATTRVS